MKMDVRADRAPAKRGTRPALPPGAVRWGGGLHVTGWVPVECGEERLAVHVDGQLVTEVRPSGWAMTGEGDGAIPARTFDAWLPQRFADGRLHRVTVMQGAVTLPGSPVLLTASAGGFASALPEGASAPLRTRADLLDRLAPMSFPMARYAEWRALFPRDPVPESAGSVAVALVGGAAIDETLASLEEQAHADWIAAALPASGPCSFDVADLESFLEGDAAGAPVVVFTPGGARFAPDALARYASALDGSPDATVAYGDIEILDADGRPWPVFFPAYDGERMLEQGYAAHAFAIRRKALTVALREGASSLYAVFLSAAQHGTVVHIPGAAVSLPPFDMAAASTALAAAARTVLPPGAEAEPSHAPGAILPSVRVRRSAGGTLAVAVLAGTDASELTRTLDAIGAEAAAAGARIGIVASRGAGKPGAAVLNAAGRAGATVVQSDGGIGWAALFNRAVGETDADLVCVLDAGVVAKSEGWLRELAGRLAAPEAAAAGPLMFHPGGVVAHMGIVAGPHFSVAPALADRVDGDPGYADLLRVAHEPLALGAGCVMIRRAAYEAAGGIDGIRFPNDLGIVDLCMKLRAAGHRIVATPHAAMEMPVRKAEPAAREVEALRAKWAEVLVADPFYSPFLTRDGVPFSALAWPPAPAAPRTNVVPPPRDVPPGFS